MKQHILRSLSFSLILLLSFSCKKEKRVLDDLPPGRFDFVYVLNDNTNHDTITGELSGPYISSTYTFIVRQELLMDKQLKSFTVGSPKGIVNGYFLAQVNTSANIDYEDHNSDHLLIHFESGNGLSGSLSLTRKK
ncbi:hypothetical protein D3C71_1125580 [compost metagenome]